MLRGNVYRWAGGRPRRFPSVLADSPSVGPARLLLELTDSLGGPVTGTSLQIEARPTGEPAWRTISARAREESAGRYVVDGYEFDVSGRWILNIRARTIEGSELARDFETEVYGGRPGQDQADSGVSYAVSRVPARIRSAPMMPPPPEIAGPAES